MVKNKHFSSSSAKIIDLDMFRDDEETPKNDTTQNAKQERSNKWYFEIGYQQSFSISVFTLTFGFGCIIPLVMPIGAIFFALKYFIDKYNMIFEYRIEYEADAYVRKRVWIFSVFSFAIFQIIMVICFAMTRDDDFIILSFLLLIFSIMSLYYFVSTEAWNGKKKRVAQPFVIDTFDEDEKSDSGLGSPVSADMKIKKKNSSTSGSVYRPEKFKVEGMTPPSASPFQIPMYSNVRVDAYLHP